MAFGGSGPIHAAGLAKELLIRQVIVPPLPGLFSTLGLLFSGVEHHDVRELSSLRRNAQCRDFGTNQSGDAAQYARPIRDRRLPRRPSDAEVASVDIRFKGQASEIRLPVADENFTETTVEAFAHNRLRQNTNVSMDIDPIRTIQSKLWRSD